MEVAYLALLAQLFDHYIDHAVQGGDRNDAQSQRESQFQGVYGLGGKATDATVAQKIYSAKGRPSNNPLIIHIAAPEDAEQYAVTNEYYYKLAKAFMPGPLTIILPKKDTIPYPPQRLQPSAIPLLYNKEEGFCLTKTFLSKYLQAPKEKAMP